MPLKTYPYDPADALKSDEDIALFLELSFEDNDANYIPHALGVAVRAKGITKVAKALGVTRQQLARSLTPEAAPTFSTIVEVTKALGLELTVKRPAAKEAERAEAAE